MITIDQMLVGAEIPYSIDMALRTPTGASITAATVTVLQGSSVATVDRVSVSGTKIIFWIKALGVGWIVMNVLATFSDTSDDGERVQVQVI